MALQAETFDSLVSSSSTEDIDLHRKLDSDSGVGSDNGDKRLSATEVSACVWISLFIRVT